MINIKEKENIYDELRLFSILRKFRKDNKIQYEYRFFKVYNDDQFIGCLIEYKVPIKSCVYFDIYVTESNRCKGYGTEILAIYKDANTDKDLFIRSNQKLKSEFLKRNGFIIVKDNLNKNLYYLENSSKGD